MDTQTIFMIYIIAAGISLVILYYIIKGAVKSAILEANGEIKRADILKVGIKIIDDDNPSNPKRAELKKMYEEGKISLEVYQTEWNKF